MKERSDPEIAEPDRQVWRSGAECGAVADVRDRDHGDVEERAGIGDALARIRGDVNTICRRGRWMHIGPVATAAAPQHLGAGASVAHCRADLVRPGRDDRTCPHRQETGNDDDG